MGKRTGWTEVFDQQDGTVVIVQYDRKGREISREHNDQGVSNRVTGNVSGSVVQARDIRGGVNL